MKSKVLIIGFVWPEPNSSAAGSRMLQLIQLFQEQDREVFFATTAAKTVHMFDLSTLGVLTFNIELNNDSFDIFISELNPNIVMFDRFMVEEQFGWRVAQQCPNALRILDTEDLHCLRKTRHKAIKENKDFKLQELLKSEITKREIASIFRCDLSLIISTYEMKILKEVFKIDTLLLYYLPLLVDINRNIRLPNFKERAGFMCIGNFRHEPNLDMVRYLKTNIWPLIRAKLPKAILSVYGSYPTSKVTQLHNEKEGFLIKGWVNNVNTVMQEAKICLAPIRFGAGIKGKFIDAMQNNLPSITTNIGAEGMYDNLEWSGSIGNTPKEITTKAVELYTNEEKWKKANENGALILKNKYSKELYQKAFFSLIEEKIQQLTHYRSINFIGSMLQHHTMQSTKYLSRWITEKEKSKRES